MEVTLDWQLLIALAVPSLVQQIKDRLPRWAIPLLAIACGVALQAVGAALTQPDVNPLFGGVLGFAGIGVRELAHQLMRLLREDRIDELSR